MSPITLMRAATTSGFPRVSGDEPVEGFEREAAHAFSPRERG